MKVEPNLDFLPGERGWVEEDVLQRAGEVLRNEFVVDTVPFSPLKSLTPVRLSPLSKSRHAPIGIVPMSGALTKNDMASQVPANIGV